MDITTQEFYELICALPNNYENRDLESYLLALYTLVEQNQHKTLTPQLLIEILSAAFKSNPASFNNDWLAYTESPDSNTFSRKFTNPLIKDDIDRRVISESEGIVYTFKVLQFQIAELHKMRDKQLKDEMRYFGITSETGNSWYNFDPFTNLECGIKCMIDNAENEEEIFQVNWQTLGEILENGRIYE